MTRNLIPDHVFWPEYLHFKTCGLSDRAIADKLGIELDSVEQRVRRAKNEPALYTMKDAPLDIAVDTAHALHIALHDATFTPQELRDWIAHRCTQQPALMAAVVMTLAAWTPKDAAVRDANVDETIADREDTLDAIEMCIGCGRDMAPKRRSRELGVLQKGAEGRCSGCYSKVRTAAKARAEAAS